MDPVWEQVHSDYRLAKQKLAKPSFAVGFAALVLGVFGVLSAQFAVNLNQDIRQQAQETSYATSGGQGSGGSQASLVGTDGITWDTEDQADKAPFLAAANGNEAEARRQWEWERQKFLESGGRLWGGSQDPQALEEYWKWRNSPLGEAPAAGVGGGPSATSVDGFTNTNVTTHVYIAGFGWVLPEKAIEFFGEKASTCGVNSAGGVCCPASACSDRTVSLAAWATLKPSGSGQVYNCIEGDSGCLRRELSEQSQRGGEIQVTVGNQGSLKSTYTNAVDVAKAISSDQRTAEENDVIRRQAEQERHRYEAQQLTNKLEESLKTITNENVVSIVRAQEVYQEYCREGQTGDVARACRELREGITEAQQLSKENGELMLQELQALSAQATRAMANCFGVNCQKVLTEYQQRQAEILQECKSTLLCNQVKDRARQLETNVARRFGEVTITQTQQDLMKAADGYVEAFIQDQTACTSLAGCTNGLFEVKSQLNALVARCEQQLGQNCNEVRKYVEERKLLVDAELQNVINTNLEYNPYQDYDAEQVSRGTARQRVETASADLLAGEISIAKATQTYEDYCRSGGGGGGYSGGRPGECTSLKTAIDSYEDATTLLAQPSFEDSVGDIEVLTQEATRIYLEDVAIKLENGAMSPELAKDAFDSYCSDTDATHQCVNLNDLLVERNPERAVEAATYALREGTMEIAEAEQVLAASCAPETQVDSTCDGLRLVISTVRGEQEYEAEQARLAEEAAQEEDKAWYWDVWDYTLGRIF